MPRYEIWKTTIIKESVVVDAPTLLDALDGVDDYDFEFVDSDSTYDAYLEETN